MHTIEVDWDNPSALKKTITTLQKRRKNLLRQKGYSEIHLQGSRYNLENILPLLDGILPIEALPGGDFYVYAHCDPRQKLDFQNDVRDVWLGQRFGLSHRPIYIGKGSGDRFVDLIRDGAHRKIRTECKRLGLELMPVKLIAGLSKDSALSVEGRLIDILGCKHLSKHGYLTNIDEGEDPSSRRKGYTQLAKKLLQKNGFNVSPN